MRTAGLVLGLTLCSLGAICAVEANEAMSDTSETKSLTIDWHFDASLEDVWRAWTDPHVVALWFGSDPNGEVLRASLDVHQGGRFEVSFRDSDGTQHTASGVYEHVQPPSELGFTWSWASEPGVQTFVRVQIEPDDTGTMMRFEHSGLGYASSHDYASGWRATFAKMQAAIAQR